MFRCPRAIKPVLDEALDVFGAAHLDEKTVVTSKNAVTVLLLPATQHYLANPDKPKGDFSVHSFYKAEAKKVSALRAFFSEVLSHNRSLFVSSEFNGFLDFEIALSKSSKTKMKMSSQTGCICFGETKASAWTS